MLFLTPLWVSIVVLVIITFLSIFQFVDITIIYGVNMPDMLPVNNMAYFSSLVPLVRCNDLVQKYIILNVQTHLLIN